MSTDQLPMPQWQDHEPTPNALVPRSARRSRKQQRRRKGPRDRALRSVATGSDLARLRAELARLAAGAGDPEAGS